MIFLTLVTSHSLGAGGFCLVGGLTEVWQSGAIWKLGECEAGQSQRCSLTSAGTLNFPKDPLLCHTGCVGKRVVSASSCKRRVDSNHACLTAYLEKAWT